MAALKIGFVGAGRMAAALAKGFVAAGLTGTDNLLGSDPSPDARGQFADACGGRTTDDNGKIAAGCDVVFIAVKPQHVADVFEELRGKLGADHLVISIAAGVTLETLAAGLRDVPRLVRVMPNTPCLIGQSASGYCLAAGATEDDARLVSKMLGAVGRAFELDESLMDAVIGLSGSGPAFVYLVIEALSDGGVRMGLPRSVATALAAQTVKGAAQMVLETGEHPGVLKDRVTSPGGTTIAGLQALEQGAVRAALVSAVEAATRRSAELGRASR